jgi:hypothetical protein
MDAHIVARIFFQQFYGFGKPGAWCHQFHRTGYAIFVGFDATHIGCLKRADIVSPDKQVNGFVILCRSRVNEGCKKNGKKMFFHESYLI